ncbi:uromodulin-like [Pyxicephalus adspersus]|uniref:uromodulin-like n=1 Tax=Pyxicephalus adspersus TaxID=30357 RepID=UPI003B5A2CAB
MQAFSVTILLFLSPIISMSFKLQGEPLVGNRAQARSNCDASGGVCSELLCLTNAIELTLKVDKLKEMNVNIPTIHLKDRRCTGFSYNDDTVNIKWALGKDICGTDLTVSGTHAIYENNVYLPLDPAGIIYREIVILNVSCSYPLDMNVSLSEILFPEISTTYINIGNNGQFKVKMAVYKDISYTTPYTDPLIYLPTKSNLYVGVYISDSGAVGDFKLLMINCHSTPTNNIYDPVKYNIITNSCPNPKDSTIRVLENGISSQGKFYIQMFKFIGDYSYVYLHCEVHLCSNTCIPSCSGSRSSGDIPQTQGTLTIGPIRLSDDAVRKYIHLHIITLVISLLFFYYDGVSHRPRLSAPPHFNGDPKQCRVFINQCTLHFELLLDQFAFDRAKVAFLMQHLTGKALAWINPLWEWNGPVIMDLRAFLETFHKVFDEPGLTASATSSLLRLRQGKQSVGWYAVQFGDIRFTEMALLDSGAAGNFLQQCLVDRYQIPVQRLQSPLTTSSVDGKALSESIYFITEPVKLQVGSSPPETAVATCS